MKLKKFAAMMLAGVMAVSMLAGCSGKGTNGGNGDDNGVVVEPTNSSVVTALNNGQDKDNDVKVTFKSDSKLDAALKQAVETAGNWSAFDIGYTNIGGNNVITSDWGTKVRDEISEILGSDVTNKNRNNLWKDDTDDADLKDGMTNTVFGMAANTSVRCWSEADAIRMFAEAMDDFIAELPVSNVDKDNDVNGDPFFSYSYTGTASMVSAQQEGGHTVYVFAYTITQTATADKVEA